MNSSYKVYKRDIEEILFSNIKKKINKISKIIFWLIFAETLITLFLIDFTSKNDTLGTVWFGISFFYCMLYTLTGYSWYGKMKMNNSGQRNWFFTMVGLGCIQLPLKFAFSATGISYILVPLIIYCIIFSVHTFTNIKMYKTTTNIFVKWLDLWINLSWVFSLLIGLLFMSRIIGTPGKMMIGFIAIVGLITIGLMITRIFFRNKSEKLFLIDSNSITFLSFAILSASVIWAIKVMAFNFTFGGVALGVAFIQFFFAWFIYRLMKKNNDEYESNFVKSFIFNIGILSEIIWVIVAKEIQGVISKNNAHFINIVISAITIGILIYGYIKLNISRNKIYKWIDTVGILCFVGSVIALTTLQNLGIFEGAQELDLDEMILYSSAGFFGLNVIISLFDWIFATTNNNKEKTWK